MSWSAAGDDRLSGSQCSWVLGDRREGYTVFFGILGFLVRRFRCVARILVVAVWYLVVAVMEVCMLWCIDFRGSLAISSMILPSLERLGLLMLALMCWMSKILCLQRFVRYCLQLV